MNEAQGLAEGLAVLLFFTASLGLPVFGPLVLVALARRRPAWPAVLRVGMACLLPPVTAGVLVLLAWLPQFDGQCGGWLGETSACGFDRYAMEAVFWAAMSLAVPAIIACVTVLVTALVLATRRRTRD